ncbi:MAG TPA: outer membrane protein assembly factor BamB [Aquabacterium sp.]|uniref:outer membrane protein assembly factor BamB n=1 Tax=Aquabacterium sp. TaxID=1872578 RepID=UPI002E363ACC|nr:outer membrane protein assembly factor BamB [Aquabacterium sp.]HEX5357899.1 outer membrane protein assembly factor BamB [Aquabacterium sp.]
MTLIRANLVNLSPVASRLTRLALSAAVVAVLAACGSSKPSPAALESLTPTVRVATQWSHRIGSVEGQQILAARNGQVTAASSDGDIVSFDIASGKERWRAKAGADLTAAVGSDGRYAAVVTQANELLAFDQGKQVWREKLPGRVITAPLVAGERVFIQSVDRSVRAYDVLDGRWLWQYQRPGGEPLALANAGVITAFRDTLLVGQGPRLVGLDPLKGTVRFDVNVGTPRGTNEVERLADLVGPLARVDDEACVRTFQLNVACLELNRGSLRWSRPQAGRMAVAADERIVVGADGADRLTAWKAENGDLLWRVDRFTYRSLSAPAVWGNRVVVGDGKDYLHVLAADDGRTVGRIELDAPLVAAPVVDGDTLLVLTRKGTLYALRAN